MVERGTDRHRSSNGGVFAKKGHVRVIKNSNMGHGQGQGPLGLRSLSSSPTKPDGKGCCSPDSFVASGSVKKGKRSHDAPVSPMSPFSRNNAPGGTTSPKDVTPRSSPSLGCHYAGPNSVSLHPQTACRSPRCTGIHWCIALKVRTDSSKFLNT